MTAVPTRWRTLIEDQLSSALDRVSQAERHLAAGDGGRALQEAYPAIVAGATIRVWLAAPPWQVVLSPQDMRRRVQGELPGLFAALTELDVQHVLTSPWRAVDAEPYVREAREFVSAVGQEIAAWLEAT